MNEVKTIQTLAVDIGGSGIKVIVLDETGEPITKRSRVETPDPAKPDPILKEIVSLAAEQGEFDRISVGFPGVVMDGVIKTAANLDSDWIGLNLAAVLSERLGKPVRVANDADIQGLGTIEGKGVELVVTLGTGFGSALFLEGKLVPNLEMGHHPFRKKDTYEEHLGRAALDDIGKKKWNKRLEKAIATLQHLFNCDHIYLGGGNTKKIEFELPTNVKIVPNVNGLLGGIALWKE
ncbi:MULTISPECIES: ROK family protein [Okeania]|uniref:ROK family protein n=1 Tax=Okeania hirsuta TaxID=1458930 RepID=A0A3N6PAI8_9CYAN|nr:MULTISPECIES: ROK family protein [Okeania]NES78562.1 ROK family protein [Okeania sp. SIO1H4]NES89662.1 ROK family protein [Okeania sp. SIO2B9]NET21971.1 ROK family protein [Okeania sp. SIO1H5]NET78823.1 ROK family protein [Okeania sp. SIO1F9]NET97405.1 ROK family protein [Okeania sp. SIO1H2]